MLASISIREFHQRYQKRLQLSYASGMVGQNREIRLSTTDEDSYQTVDYLNIIRPSSVVVIGRRESSYLLSLEDQEQRQLFDQLTQGPLSTIVLGRGVQLDEELIRHIAAADTAVFRSEMSDEDLLANLRYFLNQTLAETTTEHGVFLEIHSLGTFITGDSGVGKSELALSLIARGHRLIADDITEFSRTSPDSIDGIHPGLSNDFMEVRGLGILNIRAMFGNNALRRNKTLRMIVNMVEFTSENQHEFDRLGATEHTRNILGLEIPELTLPVAPGRNLAVLVEAAARNHLLKMGGYNSADDFIERQRRAIRANAKG
jgi:HPr kinase/phosphorylase